MYVCMYVCMRYQAHRYYVKKKAYKLHITSFYDAVYSGRLEWRTVVRALW